MSLNDCHEYRIQRLEQEKIALEAKIEQLESANTYSAEEVDTRQKMD